MKDINERILRISGSSCIEKELELGEDVDLKVKASVIKVEYHDNQDGSCDQIIVVKIMETDFNA